MSCLIVAGGEVLESQLSLALEEADVVIAADCGLEALERLKYVPNYIIGDFDSASETTRQHLATYESMESVEVVRLIPEKDDTDTEAALQLAFAHSTGEIRILGGTGSRLDHVLGNISILGQGLEQKRSVILQDAHNRIRMVNSDISIHRSQQFGTYISLFPYGDEVTGLTLEGFKYPLKDATLAGFHSLGVSNELVEEEGRITFSQGVLIIIESKD